MHSFKDARGRDWEIVIDPYGIDRVRSRLGVNLYDPPAAIEALFAEPSKLVNAIYLLCGDQTEDKVTERDFCRGFTGDVLNAARDAFLEELLFFTPSQAREPLKRALSMQRSLSEMTFERLVKLADEEMDGADLESLSQKIVDDLRRKRSSGSSTSAAGSSDSTPAA